MNDPRLASVLQAASGRIQAAIAAAADKVAVQLPPLALSATSGTVRARCTRCAVRAGVASAERKPGASRAPAACAAGAMERKRYQLLALAAETA